MITKQCRPQMRFTLMMTMLFVLASTAALFAARLPAKIAIAQDYVLLQDCTYSSGATMSNAQGSGVLVIKLKIAGKDYVYSPGSTTFSGLNIDPTGKLTGGNIKVPAKAFDDFLGSGLGIDVRGGTLTVRKDSDKTSAAFDLKAVAATPFNDSKGNPMKVDFQSGSLKLSVDSSGTANLIGSGGKPSGGQNDGSFSAAGLRVIPGNIGISLNGSKSGDIHFQMVCGNGTAYTNIPQLVTMDSGELALKFADLKVNEAGEISVRKMGLASGTPVEIALANPLDFILRVTQAQVSIDSSKRTEFKLLTDVVLPQNIKDKTGGRMALTNIPFDLVQSPVVYISMADTEKTSIASDGDGSIPYAMGLTPKKKIPVTKKLPTAKKVVTPVQIVSPGIIKAVLSRSFDFQVGNFGVTATGIIIDLSREGPDNLTDMPGITGKAWQGVYINKAKVKLPDMWQTASGDPISINTGNCYIDTNGFSGDLEASSGELAAATIGGFQANLKRLRIEVRRSSIVASDCKGSTTIPGLGALNLAVNISDAGTSALVEPGQSLKAEKLGLVVPVFSGALRSGPDDRWALWVNGAISLDVPGYDSLKGAAMAFHDLGIDDKGQFVFTSDGWLTLDNPADVDFGVFRCNISSMAFRKDQNKWMVDMNGDISLNSDLPVSGTISYEHLRVAEGPTVSVKSISVDAEVESVVKISAVLEQGDQDGGGKYLMGNANLDLTFAGGSTPLGGGFQLYVGSGSCWAVAGQVNLPEGIQLGSTGLGIFAFQGGIAHNMSTKSETGDFSSVAELKANPGSDKWLFMAGCDVATIADPSLLYSVGRMTIGLPDFYLNIHGKGWFLNQPSAEERNANAPLEVDVFMDPSVPLFRVGADVNLVIPSRSLNIVEANGGLELVASPDDVHLAVGWPYPEQAVSASVLGGVLNTRFGLLATPGSVRVRAGSGFDYTVFSGSIEADFGYNMFAGASDPYLWGGIWASGEVDFWIASIGASASLEGKLYSEYLWFNGTFTATIGMPWPVPDVRASVGVSGTLP